MGYSLFYIYDIIKKEITMNLVVSFCLTLKYVMY
nr:MAG TPA: hypothetical protein [Caudoviricetes sp.]